jgi:hypothetical protein
VEPWILTASGGPVGAGNPLLTATLLSLGIVLATAWACWAWRRRPQLRGRGISWWFWNRDLAVRDWFREFCASVALAFVFVAWLVALITA